MPATTIKIPDFLLNVFNGNIDMDAVNFEIALSNTAPGSQSSPPTTPGNGVLANVTQISYTNYGDSLTVDRRLQSVTSALSSGTYVFDAADFTITPSGGALATFRYLYIYAVRATAPINPLMLCIDLDEAVSLAASEPYNISFDALGILRAV